MAECTYNPDKKLCQYLNVEYVNQQDYVVGFVADVSDAAINKYNKETYKKYKGADYKNDIKALKHVIKGIWTKNIEVIIYC